MCIKTLYRLVRSARERAAFHTAKVVASEKFSLRCRNEGEAESLNKT